MRSRKTVGGLAMIQRRLKTRAVPIVKKNSHSHVTTRHGKQWGEHVSNLKKAFGSKDAESFLSECKSAELFIEKLKSSEEVKKQAVRARLLVWQNSLIDLQKKWKEVVLEKEQSKCQVL